MEVAPLTVKGAPGNPKISVNLNTIINEALTSTGFNPGASFQKELKVQESSDLFSDEYIIFDVEVPQQEQKIPKTTPSRVGSTPRSSPYEVPSVPSTPGPEHFGIEDFNKVRYEKPNATGRKNGTASYDVNELKAILTNINKYLRERGLPKIVTSSHRDDYVTAIHEFFGTTPPDRPSGKGKAAAKPKAAAKTEKKTVQLTTPSSSGPVSLKSKKPAASTESESSESEKEDSDVEALTSRMKTVSLKSPKSKAPVRKAESSEEESSEEEKPPKKTGLAKSKSSKK